MSPKQRILIVGGGTAGWMTALYLARIMGRRQEIEITLVESADVGVIGVGEATIPTMRQTLADLGIEESDFLIATNGAFKQAVCFRDWLQPPSAGAAKAEYFHPFEELDIKDVYAACELIRLRGGKGQDEFISLTSRQYHACMTNKAPHGGVGKQVKGFNYAYHTDAILFGKLMRERALKLGVTRIEANVRGVEGGPANGIERVVLEDGTAVSADLYIDCSGFHRLLLGKALGEPFEDFRRWLPCNRAVAASADYKKGDIVLPYTVAHAQKSGWIWDISLSSRRGTGYVFSSDHISDEDAALALANYIGVPADSISPRFIDMKTGRASRHWVRNCVAIGLSGGFIEPLESTGIMLIELGIRCLMDNWPGFVGQQKVVALQTNYNRYMRDLYEEVLEFIVMHYRLSQRQDTPFWRDSSALETPHRLQERMAVWRHKVPSHFDLPIAPAYVFGLLSYLAVLRGMCWGSDARSVYVDPASLERLEGYLGARQQQWRQSVAGLPGHAAYLLSLRG